ncbi:MAG: hypothetical protein ACOYMZ_02435 [Minisyncoccia bacterium]
MADILATPDEERRGRLMDDLQIIHSIFSPLASLTKSFTGTVLLLLRKETFGVKPSVKLYRVSCEEVPAFIQKNRHRFMSPLIFGSDYEWFEKCNMEIFTVCLTDTVVAINTIDQIDQEKGVYIIDEEEFLSEVAEVTDKNRMVTFALYL